MTFGLERELSIVCGIALGLAMAKRASAKSLVVGVAGGIVCGLWGSPWADSLMFSSPSHDRELFMSSALAACGGPIMSAISSSVEGNVKRIVDAGLSRVVGTVVNKKSEEKL